MTFAKKIMHHIIPVITLQSFLIVTHYYAASFSIRSSFYKKTIFLKKELNRFTQNL